MFIQKILNNMNEKYVKYNWFFFHALGLVVVELDQFL